MRKLISTLLFAFLMILATAGLAAYVMQNAVGYDITFVEFFQQYVFK